MKKNLELNLHWFTSLSYLTFFSSQEIYNSWIKINDIVGSNQQLLRDNIFTSNDSILINTFKKLETLQKRFNYYQNLTSEEREKQKIDLEKYENEISMIESKLIKISKSFEQFK